MSVPGASGGERKALEGVFAAPSSFLVDQEWRVVREEEVKAAELL